MASADERKAAADAIAPRHTYRLPCRRTGSAGGDHRVAIHRAPDILIKEGGGVASVATDHRAPPNRSVGYSQRLDHAKLRQRVQFRAAPDARHRHTKHAGLLHRRRNAWRDASASLDLVTGRPDLLGEPDRRMQNRRIVCCCSTSGMGRPDRQFPLGCDNGRLQCRGYCVHVVLQFERECR